jgi:putative membrane-bound dehydrogenase-like protein
MSKKHDFSRTGKKSGNHFPAFPSHGLWLMLSTMKHGLFLPVCLLAIQLVAADQSPTNSLPGITKLTGTNVAGTNPLGTNLTVRTPAPAPDPLKSFQVKKGFRLETVAEQPEVADPVAMAFDENGRLFVLEMREREFGNGGKGLVRVLEDTYGDGVFDSSTIYADNIERPMSIICYAGGVFVGAAGEILFLKDTQGDGVADARRVVYTGFAAATNKLAGPVLFNGFAWGLDNRIHCTTPGHGGDIISASAPKPQSLVLSEGNFSFDPRTFQLAVESGSSQAGICFDDRGRRFVSNDGEPFQMVMYEERYAIRNPFEDLPGPLLNPGRGGAAETVYSIRQNKPKSNPAAGGIFTTFSGATIYRDSLFPVEDWGNAFAADASGGLVHHDKFRPHGVEMIADRPLDEQGNEFLACREYSFQPRQVVTGPEGALYIADQNSAPGHGHIYRVVPANFNQPNLPDLGKATPKQLVASLMAANSWYRDTAARLLYERQDKAAIAPLVTMLYDVKSVPLGRMEALHVLDGMHMLVEPHVLKSLGDPDDRVREHGVRSSERFISSAAGQVSEVLWGQLARLAADPSPQVRYQLAFTLGQVRHVGRMEALAEILRRDEADKWVQLAVLSSLNEGAGEMFGVLMSDANFRNHILGEAFLRELLLMIGTKNDPAEVASVLGYLRTMPESPWSFASLRFLGEGLQCARSSLAAVDSRGVLRALTDRALRLRSDPAASEALRAQAILFLNVSTFAETGVGLLNLLNAGSPQTFQSAALITLGRFPDDQVASTIVQFWPLMGPRSHHDALVVLSQRPEWTRIMLGAVENGTIQRVEFSPTEVQFLEVHPDRAIAQRALNLFGPYHPASRQPEVEQFLHAAQMAGVVAHGRTLFFERCAACHKLGGDGNVIGLDLAESAGRGREQLLSKIIDPNHVQNSKGANYLVQTSDGETLTGFIASQNTRSVTLCQANGAERVVPRFRIQSIRNLGISAMPEGLETGLKLQDMADLLEYVTAAGR